MDIHIKLIGILLLVCSTTNGAALKNTNPFQPSIDMLLGKLNSPNMDAILFWNLVTLQACSNDYDRTLIAKSDQVGPTATSRAFAIIHGAMYDSMNVFLQVFKPIFKPYGVPNMGGVSKQPAAVAAIMEAAYQTLLVLYPQQQTMFDAVHAAYLKQLPTNIVAVTNGILIGQLFAFFILSNRANDKSQVNGVYTPNNLPGYHLPDPTHPNQGYLGVSWGNVTPFIIQSGSQFRASNFVGQTPADRLRFLNSNEYITHYNEVKSYGARNSTTRTPDQTEIGIFWSYDGTSKVGVPPRIYNQIVRVIAIQQKNTLEQNARLFALVNYAMADAGIAAWDSKYYYAVWRPIVGIRQGSSSTIADTYWLPLGAQADNTGDNFTPAFPSYVSGHAAFGSAVFQVLRLFYGTDSIQFAFQSDEYNGQTVDSITGLARPATTRQYGSFTQAENENFLARIYLGVHWRFDQEEGLTMGQNVGTYVYNKMT
jgi:hypothetical protein